MLRNRRGSVESINYFLLVGVVAAALIGMQVYVKRGVQGRINKAMHQVSAEGTYSPGATAADSIVRKKIREDTYTRGAGRAGEEERYTHSSAEVLQEGERFEETLPYEAEPAR